MSNETQAILIHEIGEMIVNDAEYRETEWASLALAVTLDGPTRRMTGYIYMENGDFSATIPDEMGDILRKLTLLKADMEENGDGAFRQCLIHITKPDYDLRLQFEFDNPSRWALGAKGMDMSGFANMLRPE